VFRRASKISAAVSFLLILAVPTAFYRSGYRGALIEAAFVVTVFAAATVFGHRWMKSPLIDLPSKSFDVQLGIGLAVTTASLVFAQAQLFLGPLFGLIANGLQYSVLIGLLSSSPKRPSAWKRGFWRKPEYLPAMVLLLVASLILIAAFWSHLRWWSLLVVSGVFIGNELGEQMGRSVRQWLLALKSVWDVARRMGPPLGAFALGYLVIAFIFAGLFASVWRADSNALKGMTEHPGFTDFAYYSVMTMTTTGYGDVAPQSHAAKILASAEALIGLAWTVVIFAAVLVVVQQRLQAQERGQDRNTE
jgi:voltage-gated potassium channel